MAYLGKCPGCEEGNHDLHVVRHHTPVDTGEFVCGGGNCICKGNCDLPYDEWLRESLK